jgi:hypothetical protein
LTTNQPETKAVTKLEDKIENLDIKRDQPWDIWGSIGSHWEAIITIFHLGDVAGFAYMAGYVKKSFVPFSLDMLGSLTITMMNIWYAYYPEEENKQNSLYIQYLIYSFILGSSLFVTGTWILPNSIWVIMSGISGMYDTVTHQYELNKTNEKLEETKRKLVDVLENPTK